MNDAPFLFGSATSGVNFTDRVKETERLKNNFIHGVNTILISPRRWGKTSLVKKVCDIAKTDKLRIIYIDIFSCRNEKEFYDVFTSAILKQTSSKFDEFVENAKKFITHITPKFNVGLDPMNDFSLSLEWNDNTASVDEILQLPEKISQKKNIKIVLCIDEFQQIAEFRDSKTFQKRLRAVWQLQKNVSYCLFGSKKHLMNELFENKSLPFYKFGDSIYLEKIKTEDWIKYICSRFECSGKYISEDMAEKICLTVENHSSYVQQFAWLLWINTNKEATQENFDDAYNDLINQNSLLFERQTENLSSYQMNLLRALKDGINTELTSQKHVRKYDLGSSANVAIVKKALIKKELIEKENKKIVISDPVMKLWLQRELG